MSLYELAFLVFVINLPFGYLRGKSKKYSLKWFLYIHLPIPMIILLRIYSGLGFQFYTFPWTVGAFFLGQVFGAKLSEFIMSKNEKKGTCE